MNLHFGSRTYEKADYFCLFFITLGVFARVWIYITQGELLIDEAYLAPSVYYSSFKDIIIGNLPYNQAVPLGFILSVKLLDLVFGNSEYILRLIPFLFGVLLLPLAYLFAMREFGARFACIFLFLISISDPLLFYTVQFKQYSSEAFVAMFYLYLFSLFRNEITLNGNIPWKLIAFASILTLFGNSPIFVLCGIFFVILYEQKKNVFPFLRKNCIKIFVVILVCSTYYCLYLARINSISNGFMEHWWSEYYLPQEFSKIPAYFQYYVMPLIGSYFTVITYSKDINALFFIVCFCIGNFLLLREKKYIFIVITVTTCMLLFLYLVRFYPIGVPLDKNKTRMYVVGIRLLVYFIPLSLVPVSLCLEKFWDCFLSNIRYKVNYQSSSYRFIALFAFFIMACFAVYANKYRIKEGVMGYEIKPILEKINYFQNESSIIFMNKGAEPLYLYYQQKNNEYAEYNLFDDLELPPLHAERKIIEIKDTNSIAQIFNIAYSAEKEYLIFFFVQLDEWVVWQWREVFNYLRANYPQNFLAFDSGYRAVGFFVNLRKNATPPQQ